MSNSTDNSAGEGPSRGAELPDGLRQVKAVVFDTFGTVVDWRSSLIGQFEAFGQRRGIPADWAGLVDAWRGGYEASKDKVRTGATAQRVGQQRPVREADAGAERDRLARREVPSRGRAAQTAHTASG